VRRKRVRGRRNEEKKEHCVKGNMRWKRECGKRKGSRGDREYKEKDNIRRNGVSERYEM
jgi:hypothetical protein